MEDTGIEPVTIVCKTIVFPLTLIPQVPKWAFIRLVEVIPQRKQSDESVYSSM